MRTKGGGRSAARRWSSYRIHKWAGLAAGLWLLVLGVTGFMLDHRDWRWMWQQGVPEVFASERIVDKARSGGVVRLYRIDPEAPESLVAGGMQGLWWSNDAGRSWSRTVFAQAAYAGARLKPRVYAVVEDSALGWDVLWVATDDGLWVSRDRGKTAVRVALPGLVLTAMAEGSEPGELVGVVDRSVLFRLGAYGSAPVEWLKIAPVGAGELPAKVALSSFVYDLHFGRGLFSGAASLVINDAGAIAMVFLPVTGFLFWWLPRRWRGKKAAHGNRRRRKTMRGLFTLHSTVLGLVVIVPVVYLSITGLLINHRDIVGPWMRSVEISRGLLPPVYRKKNWDGEINAIAGYPGEPQRLSIGTRGGMYTSGDAGARWKREVLPGPSRAYIWYMRRMGDDLFVSPNLTRSGSGPWRHINGGSRMPSDVTRTRRGKMVWKTYRSVMVETDRGEFVDIGATIPLNDGVPWFYVIDGLHSGLFIHPQWKWVNGVVSVMAVILSLTGLIRWWRRRAARTFSAVATIWRR